MGVQLDRVAANLKKNGLPTENNNPGDFHAIRIHRFDGKEAICLASVKSQAGNHTGFWKVWDDDKTYYQITTKFADDGSIVRKELQPHELHRILIAQTRRQREG